MPVIERVGPVRRVLALVWAVGWFVPWFGLIDLTVTWDDEWPVVLEAGWGMFHTMLVGVPFVAVGVCRRVPAAVPVLLWVSVAALALSGVVAREFALLAVSGVLVAQVLLVVGVPSRPRIPSLPRDLISKALLVLTLASAVPWTAYALDMWRLNRQAIDHGDITNGIDHYSVQGAFAISLVVLSAVMTVAPQTRRFVGACVGLSAAYIGLLCLVWHPTPGSFGQPWSTLCLLWGLLLVVLPWLPLPSADEPADRERRHSSSSVSSSG